MTDPAVLDRMCAYVGRVKSRRDDYVYCGHKVCDSDASGVTVFLYGRRGEQGAPTTHFGSVSHDWVEREAAGDQTWRRDWLAARVASGYDWASEFLDQEGAGALL